MNINFFGINNFDKAHVLARKSDGTLPEVVKDNLRNYEKEEKLPEGSLSTELLGLIEEFEKSPTDLSTKKAKYDRLMELFYKGVGLDEDGNGTISKDNERAALELSGLINDAILQDQQNIDGNYSSSELKEALNLQKQFRKDLENTDFKRLLTEDQGSNTEISANQKEYQTEKITSYLAENKEDFTAIFQELSKEKPDLQNLTQAQRDQLENLKTLAGKDAKGSNILNTILSTFKDFKEYRFNDDMTKMTKTDGAALLEQAKKESSYDNWAKVAEASSEDEEEEDVKEDNGDNVCKRSSDTDRILERILTRLEKLEDKDDEDKEDVKEDTNSTNWLDVINDGINLAGNFLNTTGIGQNNRNNCCYSPAPCYECPPPPPDWGRGACPPPRTPCRTPYYVGGDTWPWGRTAGGTPSDSIYSNQTRNDFSPSSNNPINIEVNPTFNNNNNPIQTSRSVAQTPNRSSNQFELRQRYT